MTNRNKHIFTIGSLAVVIAAILWSLDGILREKLYHLPAINVVFLEHGLASLILIPIMMIQIKSFKKFTKKQIAAIALVSLVSGVIGTAAYTSALFKINYIPFSVVVMIQKLQPIFATLAAGLLLKEKISKRFAFMIPLALVLSYWLTFPDLSTNLSTGNKTLQAALLALLAAACWGTMTAFSKYSLKNVPTINTTSLRMIFTAGFSLIYIMILGNRALFSDVGTTEYKYLLMIIFSTGLVAIYIYYYGLKKIPATLCTFLELAWPISAVFVDKFYFHKNIRVSQLIAGTLLISVLILMTKTKKDVELDQKAEKISV